jgi:hypothetical protein
MRKCLLEGFYKPANGRGGYVDSERSTLWGWLGPLVGPTVHVKCLREID